MKKLTAFVFVLMLLTLSGELMAQEQPHGEVCLAGILLGDMSSGAISLGYYSKFAGVEANGTVLEDGVVFGGNLLAGFFEKGFTPYATGGIWVTTGGYIGFNLGGGLKIKITKRIAIRAEYRRYFYSNIEWGVNVLAGGLSFSF